MMMPQKFSDKRDQHFRREYGAATLPIMLASLIGATAVRVLFPGMMEETGIPLVIFMLTAFVICTVLCLLRVLLRKLFLKALLRMKQNDADGDRKE